MPGKAGKEKISAPRFPIFFTSVGFAVFAFDRVSKWAVLARLEENQSVPVWPGIFHLTRIGNTGAAFGLFKNHSFLLAVLAAVSIAVIAFFSWKRYASGDPAGVSRLASAGWAMVLGGAAGNLYDRFFFGHVIDFLDFRVWPVFNVADSAICAGVFFVILRIFLQKEGKGA